MHFNTKRQFGAQKTMSMPAMRSRVTDLQSNWVQRRPSRHCCVVHCKEDNKNDKDRKAEKDSAEKQFVERLKRRFHLRRQSQLPGGKEAIGWIGAYVGLQGTIAVAAAYFFNVDAFGNFHWNLTDVHSGLLLAVPLAICNLIIMLPDHQMSSKEKSMISDFASSQDLSLSTDEQSQPNEGACPPKSSTDQLLTSFPLSPTSSISATEPDDSPVTANLAHDSSSPSPSSPPPSALPSAGRQVPAYDWGRQSNMPARAASSASYFTDLRKALALVQLNQVNRTFIPTLPWPLNLGLLAGETLSQEMLFRAVLLTALSNWTAALLFQADAEDVLLPLGTSPSEVAPWAVLFTVLLLISSKVGIMVSRARRTIRRIVNTDRPAILTRRDPLITSRGAPGSVPKPTLVRLPGSPPSSPPFPLSPPTDEATDEALAAIFATSSSGSNSSSRQQQRRSLPDHLFQALSAVALSAGISAGREILEIALASSAYLATGNLAASFTMTFANKVLLTSLQRHAVARQAVVRG